MAQITAPAATTRPRDLEVWWKVSSDRWPLAPKGHYLGPDGRLLSPGEFAAYVASPARMAWRILVTFAVMPREGS